MRLLRLLRLRPGLGCGSGSDTRQSCGHCHVQHSWRLSLWCLAQMILDKQFEGTLDQGAGCLEVFDAPKPDTVYPEALATISSMSNVVDTLFTRSQNVAA